MFLNIFLYLVQSQQNYFDVEDPNSRVLVHVSRRMEGVLWRHCFAANPEGATSGPSKSWTKGQGKLLKAQKLGTYEGATLT